MDLVGELSFTMICLYVKKSQDPPVTGHTKWEPMVPGMLLGRCCLCSLLWSQRTWNFHFCEKQKRNIPGFISNFWHSARAGVTSSPICAAVADEELALY